MVVGKTSLVFSAVATAATLPLQSTQVIAERDALRTAVAAGDASAVATLSATWSLSAAALAPLVRQEDATPAPLNTMSFWKDDKCLQFNVITDKLSRNMGHIRSDKVTEAIKSGPSTPGDARIVVILKNAKQALSAGIAISRAYHEYNQKTGKDTSTADRTITVSFACADEAAISYPEIQVLAENARLAACLYDTPTSELHTDSYLEKVREVAKEVGADLKIIQGKDLDAHVMWSAAKETHSARTRHKFCSCSKSR